MSSSTQAHRTRVDAASQQITGLGIPKQSLTTRSRLGAGVVIIQGVEPQ